MSSKPAQKLDPIDRATKVDRLNRLNARLSQRGFYGKVEAMQQGGDPSIVDLHLRIKLEKLTDPEGFADAITSCE